MKDLKIHVSFMIMLYGFLVDRAVDARSFYAFMSKQLLYLFNWHASI